MAQTDDHLAVLHEMVRLAEMSRTEALNTIERINKYNLALIAFAGSFLSLLISTNIAQPIVQIAGASLIITIILCLYTIRPQRIQGGTPDITDDIQILRSKQQLILSGYLLDVAELTNNASIALQKAGSHKKRTTIVAASFLAFSLVSTYSLVAYAKAI